MSSIQNTSVCGLSQDERKMVLFALAHLATFLPQWDGTLQRIAQKLDSSSGAGIYEGFKKIANGEPAVVRSN